MTGISKAERHRSIIAQDQKYLNSITMATIVTTHTVQIVMFKNHQPTNQPINTCLLYRQIDVIFIISAVK
jgi:uncharacterized protein YhhL (DUF1145 family)